MRENLINNVQSQRQKTIDNFKMASRKYIAETRINLWDKYIDKYYSNTQASETSMEEIFKYIDMLSSRIKPRDVAYLFMDCTSSFANASIVAKTVAFFSIKGGEFYKELENITLNENREDLIDKEFALKLREVDACDDIDEALLLFQVKTANISLANYEDIQVLIYENGFIKGLTQDKKPVIGQKIDNQYVFYIIGDSSYERFLIYDPNPNQLKNKRQTIWGFITNESGKFIEKVKEVPKIIETDDILTLSELHNRGDIHQYLSDNYIILSIMREIYELGLPINEKSDTLTIKAIMFREMQEAIKLQKEPKQ